LRHSDAAIAVNDAFNTIFGSRNPSSGTRRAAAMDIIREETGDLLRQPGQGVQRFPSGREVKDIDSRLSQRARDLENTDAQMARAIREARDNLRSRLRALPNAPPGVLDDLQAANRARAQLYPLQDASVQAAKGGGHFTATQSFKSQAAQPGAPRSGPITDSVNRMVRDQEDAIAGFMPQLGGLALGVGSPIMAGMNTRFGRRALSGGAAELLPAELRPYFQRRGFAQGAGQFGRVYNTPDEE